MGSLQVTWSRGAAAGVFRRMGYGVRCWRWLLPQPWLRLNTIQTMVASADWFAGSGVLVRYSTDFKLLGALEYHEAPVLAALNCCRKVGIHPP